MKRILLSFVCVFLLQTINANNNSIILSAQTGVNVIEITDTTLDNIYYSNTNFDEPTKLIFTNLTTINGSISFTNTVNLVAIEFPVLETVTGNSEFFEFNSVSFHQNNDLENIDFPILKSIYGHLYFHQNLSLKTINLISLETVYSYVYARGNTALETFDICNLKEILPQDEFDSPYYSIEDNTVAVDSIQPCWGTNPPTDIAIDNTSINENEAINTLIGTLTSTPANENLIFYFDDNDIINDQGEDYANGLFKIIDNQLLSKISFDFEAQNEYQIKIYVRNNYGEKFGKEFTININDVQNENINIVEITDVTLDKIYYSDTSFDEPTKLIFTNLTTVSSNISFYTTSNLVAVEFPKLVTTQGGFSFHQNNSIEEVHAPLLNSIGSHVYFHQNLSLKTINLNNLETVFSYVYIRGNSSLETLEICNLIEILAQDEFDNPYYSIGDNSEVIDSIQPCWGTNPPTDITLDHSSISENENIDTLIGNLSSAPSNDNLFYYFDNDDFINIDGEEYANDFFKIINNQLISTTSFDFEANNEYLIKIAVRNNYGENFSKEFTIIINDIQVETINVIEITDTTLDNISFYDTSFVGPTKLVYTNLTTINGNVTFNNNLNIQELDFPVLENIYGHVYISKNYSLTKANLPTLKTINDYIYVTKNNILTDLNICSLTDIVQSQSGIDPYYYIKNNPLLNYDSTCLTNTIITLNYLDNIIEEDGKLLAATFSSNAGDEFIITYFFIDDDGEEITNEDFEIIDNKLYLTKDLSYYIAKDFVLKIGAIRYENTTIAKSTLKYIKADSGLNERIEEKFNVNISDSVLSTEDLIDDKHLNIFPNPSYDILFMKGTGDKLIEEVQVFDVLGKIQSKATIQGNRINISYLNSGVYFIRFKMEDNFYSKKIIKK